MSATTTLPRLDAALTASADVQAGISGVVRVVTSLGSGSGDDPLAAVANTLDRLEDSLDIDVSGIGERLPQALTTIRNALPSDTLRYVEGIEGAYRTVTESLGDSELVRQVQAGAGLEQTALAVVDDVLRLFQSRLADLAADLVDADDLERVRDALALVDDLRTDPTANAGELLPLLSEQLLGVPDDLLAGARAHVDSALSVLAPLAPGSVAEAVNPALQALGRSTAAVAEAIAGFDPADATVYAELQAELDVLDGALDVAFDALEATYRAVGTVIDRHAWDRVFTGYADILDALPLDAIPTVDDAVDQVAGVLDDLLSRLTMALSPEDVAERITRFAASIEDTFTQSPLGQVRRVVVGFLDDIRATIEAVPTEDVRDAVTAMLQRVRQELDALGITGIRDAIEQGFADAQAFIDEHLDAGLLDQVQQALQTVLDQLGDLPVADVAARLTEAVDVIGGVVEDLESALHDGIEQIRGLLAQLDQLSFRPVADEVLEEIRALEAKLRQIKPEALSDAERLAISAGLALLRAIDLDGMIETELMNGFAEVANELRGLVNQVVAAWEQLRARLDGFDPQVVIGPLAAVMDDVTGTLAGINGATLLAPVYGAIETVRDRLSTLSPGALLDPLGPPYAQMMALVARADPDVWVQPLRALHGEIDRLLGYVDLRPLLDTLSEKQRELFAQARETLVAGLDTIDLPAPLDAFWAQMKTVVLTVADVVFGDPDEPAPAVTARLRGNVSLSSLFSPLDRAFDELLGMVDQLPRDELVTAMEALRAGLGAALPALDPRNLLAALRAGQGRLAELSPVAAAGAVAALPALRVSLAARLELAPAGNRAAATSLQSRFDLVLTAVQPDVEDSRLRRLQAAHDQVAAALRRRINGLEASGAQAAYDRVYASLDRLLPAFLRQAQPLVYDDIRAGLAELRPSVKAARLDAAVERFLAQLRPLEGALEAATNTFFGVLRESVLLLDPAILKDAVGEVYETLRAKLTVLEPDELAAELRANLYEPVLDGLRALDPATLKAQLDELYRGVLASLTGRVTGFVDQVRTSVDRLLADLRAALTSVLAALRTQIEVILAKLRDVLGRLDALVLEDVLGRLRNLIDSLEASFNQELGRVRSGFHAMLAAIPLGGPSATASVGA